MDEIEVVGQWLVAARRVTVLTGAGISTESGIADFRGPNGLWTRDPSAARMFELSEYVRDADLRARAWINRRDHAAWTAAPNAGHLALVDLERSGRLRALLTQNIDGLHQQAGSDPERVVELHGTLYGVECLSCGQQTRMVDALARVAAGEADPLCEQCDGIQKAATISFGQSLRTDVIEAALAAAADCDLFLAIGTTLQVNPAAGMCEVALRHGARLVVLNADPTPYDSAAAAVLRGRIGAVLPTLVAPCLEVRAGQ